MPEPVAIQRALTDNVLNDNCDFCVPDDLYNEYVRPLLKEIKQYNVDPYTTKFDPERHLLFTDDYFEKTKRLTLSDLGHTNLHQEPISEIGVSEPFPLFTDEAIALMRFEIMKEETFKKYARFNRDSTTGDKDMYVRGYAGTPDSFTHQAWTHPRTQAIIDKMCGVELVYQFDYEVGHINVSLKQASTKILDVNEKDETKDAMEIPGIVSWHYDSPQFVCVLMLSDTTNMIGGETALMKGDGTVVKAEGPKRGWATILQGRIIKHIATKPKGDFTERITSVTSYRPKNVLLDNSPITTVKPSVLTGSHYNGFYQGYMNYRLDVLAKRVEILKEKINSDIAKGEKFNQLETIEFLQKQISEYCEQTWQEFEVVDDGLVPKPKSYNVKQSRWL